MLSQAVPTEISEYTILQLSLPLLPSFPTPAKHYLYIRPHAPKDPDACTPRSLFLVNIPIDSTKENLRHLLSTQLGLPSGRIEDVQFENDRRKLKSVAGPQIPVLPAKPVKRKDRKRKREAKEGVPELDSAPPETWDRDIQKSGSNAVVVFVDRTSMLAAFQAVQKTHKSKSALAWEDGFAEKAPPLGSKRYNTHHSLIYPSPSTLLASVNKYMTAYAAREAARVNALKRQRQEPDADGFVTVTRGGRTGAARQDEAAEKLELQTKKQSGFEDFYRFQSREKRKEKEGELRRKFEEDREKVRRMREGRGRFKPE